jgi:hypothetical protein
MRWCGAVSATVAVMGMGWLGGCAANGDADPEDPAAAQATVDSGVFDAHTDYGNVPADAGTHDSHVAFDAGHDSAADPTAACVSQNNCFNATLLPAISGDTGSDSHTETGNTAKWLQIPVREDYHEVGGRKVKVMATLTSPPGANFDLYLYVDPDGDETSRACTAPSASSLNGLGMDTATAEWGDGLLGSSSNDTRIVSVEVRHISGDCAPGQSWALTLTGN